MSHTPTPYAVGSEKCDGLVYFEILDQQGRTIADTSMSAVACIEEDHDESGAHRWDEQGRQDAEFIVRACNAHDALLAACEEWVRYFDELNECSLPGDRLTEMRNQFHAKRVKKTREAIAIAKGTP